MGFPKVHGLALAANSFIENLTMERLVSDPVPVSAGRLWYNTTDKVIKYSGLDAGGAVVVEVIATGASAIALAARVTTLEGLVTTIQGSMINKDGSVAFTGDVNVGGNSITNVASPVNGTDAVNMDYVTSAIAVLGNAFEYVGTVDGGVDVAGALDLALQTKKEAGDYYKVAVAGYFKVGAGAAFFANAGDGLIFNTSAGVDKIDNTDSNVAGTVNYVTVTGSADTGFTVDIASEFKTRVSDLETDLDAEVIRATGVEGGLDTRLTAAEGAATTLAGRVTTVEGGLAQEIIDRGLAITGEVTARNSAISTAVSAEATRIDGALATAISTEVSDRNIAIAAEATRIDGALATAISGEVTARNTAITTAVAAEASRIDGALATAISTEVSDRNTAITSAVAAEATARDLAIGTAVSAEATRIDGALATAISTEVTNRNSAITTAVAAEAVARDAAILVETNRALAAEGAIDTKVGSLATLGTTDKSSIVNAINNVLALAGGGTSAATAAILASINGQKFRFASAAPALTHVITHNLGTAYPNVDIRVKGDDGVFRNDIVAFEETDGNTVTVFMTEARDIKVSILAMEDTVVA